MRRPCDRANAWMFEKEEFKPPEPPSFAVPGPTHRSPKSIVAAADQHDMPGPPGTADLCDYRLAASNFADTLPSGLPVRLL